MIARAARAAANESGVVTPATAVLLAVLIGMVGLVTDTSVWYAQRGQLQAVTDAAALAAAPYADDAGAARRAANAVLTANGLDPAVVVTGFSTGQYCADYPVNTRYAVAGCEDAETSANDAVRVSTGMGTPLILSRLFAAGVDEHRIVTVATAARVNQAGIQAGTGLAALNGGIANAVLSSLTGGSVSLSAVQYDGLLKTNVDALTFLDALAARLNVSAGTYDSLLQSSVGVGDVIAAQIAALSGQSNVASTAAAIAGLRALQTQISGNPRIALGSLFDLGLMGSQQIGNAASKTALHAGLNLMQLTTFTLQLANRNNAAAIPSSSIGIPGLASIQIAATAIEPPVRSYFSFGPEGTQVHSAQVRLKLNLQVLNLVPQLGVGVSLPLYIEAASGDAEITDISCAGNPAQDASVAVSARSGIADVYIGSVSDSLMRNFSAPVAASAITPVRILNLGIPGILTLADTSARAHVSLGSTNGAATSLGFVQPGATAPVQPVPPTNRGVIGRPATDTQTASQPVVARATSTAILGNLLSGLAESLSVKACTLSLLGGCLLPVTLTGAGVGTLYTVLRPVLNALDPVLDGLLRALGVQLGYVDVAVTGVRCGYPVLVS